MKTLKLYDVTFFDPSFLIQGIFGLISIVDYIHEWRLVVFETYFFKEVRSKDGI
jgi:hypothetical protein